MKISGQERPPDSALIKFHKEIHGFNKIIAKEAAYILHLVSTKNVRCSPHYLLRCREKAIPTYSLLKIALKGDIFEYKLNQDKELTRIAVRVPGKYNDDYIYVIEFLLTGDQLMLRFITAYANQKNDSHRTLDKSKYNHDFQKNKISG